MMSVRYDGEDVGGAVPAGRKNKGENLGFAQRVENPYFVHKCKEVIKNLTEMWGNGPPKEKRNTMEGASYSQKCVKNANVLWSQLKAGGSLCTLVKSQRNFTYDSINDMFHCHLGSSDPSYVVFWEEDTDNRIINVTKITSHANIKVQCERKHNKEAAIRKAVLVRNAKIAKRKEFVDNKAKKDAKKASRKNKH